MNKEEICHFVNTIRLKQQVSQSDLAHKIGKRRQAIFEIENNLVDFRISAFIDMVEALGYKLELMPIKSEIVFDFSKIKPAQPDQPVGPFKKRKSKKK
jgi:DNA-binding XRE family transcriptional regulator